MARSKPTTAGPRFLVVHNLSDGVVGFAHPDDQSKAVALMPYESVALDAKEWDDVPDIERLVEASLLATEPSDKRPRRAPLPPSSVTELPGADKDAARIIAFTPEDGANKEQAYDLIFMMPERESPLPGAKNPMVDVLYLKQQHVKVLNAACWYLANYKLAWSATRLAEIRQRIQTIEEMQQ